MYHVIQYEGIVSFLLPQKDPEELDGEELAVVRQLSQVNTEARREVLHGHHFEKFTSAAGRRQYCFVNWDLDLFRTEDLAPDDLNFECQIKNIDAIVGHPVIKSRP